MGARRRRAPNTELVVADVVFCCDSDALIYLHDAGLLRKLKQLVSDERIKMSEGVERELQRVTDKLRQNVHRWNEKYSVVVRLDHRALELLPEIERKYGPAFSVGRRTYGGFWKSASGWKSIDGQLVALAKARGWIVVSNDDSVHGACMQENVPCRRWEEIGRLLLFPAQPQLPHMS